MRYVPARVLAAVLLALPSAAFALVPDNGSGTARMPLDAPYPGLSPMSIVNGLPPGTTVSIDSILTSPPSTNEVPGGSLSGTVATSTTSFPWQWSMTGTGTLSGYNRVINMPVANFEVHTAPRTPYAPLQSFDTTLYSLQAQITSDPDFDLLRVTVGDGFGLPSPGHTTLYQSGSNWAVDSFFDITYRIDFVGHPGSPFGGMSGSTTGTIRIATTDVPEPASLSVLSLAALPLLRRRRR